MSYLLPTLSSFFSVGLVTFYLPAHLQLEHIGVGSLSAGMDRCDFWKYGGNALLTDML